MPKFRVPDYFKGRADATLPPNPNDEDRHGKDGHRRHSVSGYGPRPSGGRHPRYVIDLTKEELRKLINVLHTDTTRTTKHDESTKKKIADLPKRVRRERFASSNKDMCRLHYGVNSDVICNILELIKREVEFHMLRYDRYPHLLRPLDQLILSKLRGTKGMWTKERSAGFWPYQENCCHACMVGRVTNNKAALRSIRVSQLARTRKRHHSRLNFFVDLCIDQFPECDELYRTSSQFAFILNDTRKKCIKAWYNDANNKRSRHGSGHPRRSDSKYDPRKDYVQTPPEIALRHPSQQYDSGGPSSIRRAETNIGAHSMHQGSSTRPKNSSSSRRRQDSVIHRDISRSRHGTKSSEAGPSSSRSHGHSTTELRRKRVPSPPPSSAMGPPDEVDKLIDMYRNMGTNPYKRRAERLATGHNDRQVSNSVEVPVAHQYTASEYTPSVYSEESEWVDDEIVDWEAHERHMSKCESDAMTVWSMVCGEANKR
ncbi:hypothetical protein PENARI_c010G10985 [Penicillium arizonense]|uniref:Uncharacterized protein n=1 Tax=Penicillium arizonense TaxID=1835702 RepID=A0A1F5LHE5_PENAI|nr:hypothetical protein PENARI_c010G10985 [Penicillium arizonense]OGE52537.1 hypothetical protein PENARI_c010G10985 [Penicillium arizonense]